MKKIRMGVVGAGRGMDIAHYFMMQGCEVVALCDLGQRKFSESRLPQGATFYDDFYKFIDHDMDAVLLGNNFHEHAPYAIECFKRNLHVYSECISNSTMAEGVELIRAFEKSKSIYMLAENYPFMTFNREIKRVCETGTLGKFLYAESEYNHPSDPFDIAFRKRAFFMPKHWRNFMPMTYYITHCLGPVMWATGATPKKVSANAVFSPVDESIPTSKYNADKFATIITQNDDGSVFRVCGCSALGGQHHCTRVCGTKGQIENLRGTDDNILLRYNPWDKPEGVEKENQLYVPTFEDKDEKFIKQSGHAGSDFLAPRMFIECIRENKQPVFPFDIHSAVNMSSVAILAHRSILNGGIPYDIPDFHNEDARLQYEKDDATPFYYSDGRTPNIPCCSHPDYKPTDKQLKEFYDSIKD